MHNKIMTAGLLFTLVGALLPQALFAADAAAPAKMSNEERAKAPVSATLDIDIKEIGLIFGGQSGKGVLHFQGKDYPFTLKGLQAGVIVGATRAHVSGDVRFLTKVEDFEGSFSAAGAGATMVKGGEASSFQNNKGVVFTLKAKTTGLGINLGLTGGNIRFIK
jgi:lipid-binding SYLF domain-containing protein